MGNLILGSTIVFAPHPIDVALEGLAEAGYRNVEIGAVKGWFEHIDPDTVSDAEIDRIGRKLGELGLNPVSLSGHTQLQTTEEKNDSNVPWTSPKDWGCLLSTLLPVTQSQSRNEKTTLPMSRISVITRRSSV
ncbi:MAG: hypothetical protein R2839_00860 [Thermomicrobiales bacterium]